MNILHIIPDLHGGGAQKFCMDLANEQAKTHYVTVCSLFDIEEHMFMAKGLDQRVKVITLHKKLGLDISIFFKIAKLIKHGHYDIINTHLRALFYSMIPVLSGRYTFFHTIHNMANKEAFCHKMYNFFFHYRHVKPIGISPEVLKSIHDLYGEAFSIMIPNGTKPLSQTQQYSTTKQETDRYRLTPSTKLFLTIGRIEKQKNHTMLVDVFNRLIKDGYDVALMIIGDDPSTDKATLTALQAKASDRIHFLGMKANIADYLLCSDGFCLSSLYEGLPITLLEALSLGIIPLCTPVGGMIDVIVDGDNGFLSQDVSSDAFYEMLSHFCGLSGDELLHLQKRGRETFEASYDIALTSQRYLTTYQLL